MEEKWRDIPGYEGIYQASSLGRIKRVKCATWNGKTHCEREEKILKQQCCKNSRHPFVRLSKGGRPKMFRVRTLICLAFIGEKPQGHSIIAINRNTKDNRACNLKYQNLGTGNKSVKNNWKTSNKKRERLITYKGTTKNCSDWSKELGGSHALVCERLRLGWDTDKAVTIPVKKKRQ